MVEKHNLLISLYDFMGDDFQSLPKSTATSWSNINVVSATNRYATHFHLSASKIGHQRFLFQLCKTLQDFMAKVANNKITMVIYNSHETKISLRKKHLKRR